jgi:hypothetical protein
LLSRHQSRYNRLRREVRGTNRKLPPSPGGQGNRIWI